MDWLILVVVAVALLLLWWLAPGVLGILLVPLAWLAAVVVWWVVPLIAVAVLLPLFQVLAALNPWAAALVMLLIGGLIAWYFATHGAPLQSVLWGTIWGVGALMAIVGVFNWYALFLESVLIILLLVPGVVVHAWAGLLRWFAVGELALTLLLLWGQGAGLPGPTLVFALLLLVLAALLGAGAYRPFEARRIRRRLATMAAVAAVVLLLWQPVIQPAASWLGQAGQAFVRAVSTSPLGRWYRVASLRAERVELGERAKTQALRQLQPQLTEAHKARWERAIREVPQLPLAGGEWGDLGIPPQADP
jgi:hypothetical protein